MFEASVDVSLLLVLGLAACVLGSDGGASCLKASSVSIEAKERIRTAQAFHNRTKHDFDRMSPRKGNPQWEDQPNAFRTFIGAPLVHLPIDASNGYASLVEGVTKLPHQALFDTQPQPELVASLQSVSEQSLGSFLALAMGLTAWKEAGNGGNRWTLRANPSSGALHPTEAYILLSKSLRAEDADAPAGLYHYHPFEHTLERRLDWSMPTGTEDFGFFVALSSVIVRESFKYGERAFRYANHDVGHAIATIALSASLHGWRALWMKNVDGPALAKLLYFGSTAWEDLEEEEPDILLWIHTAALPRIDTNLDDAVRLAANNAFDALKVAAEFDLFGPAQPVKGNPARLARSSIYYEEIYAQRKVTEHINEVASRCVANLANEDQVQELAAPYFSIASAVLAQTKIQQKKGASALIHQRRSVQEMDPTGNLRLKQFMHILAAVLPHTHHPFLHHGLTGGMPGIHLLIFVHRVKGLDPGIYLLVRNSLDLPDLRRAMKVDLLWEAVPLLKGSDPQDSPLFRLVRGDMKQFAEQVSCNQQIAGASAFSLGMLARWHDWQDASRHKELFWESGMVGQSLYLSAEVHGMRGTGIGCFYDDPVHNSVQLRRDMFSSIYHFTAGKSLWIEDSRVLTKAPYEHLMKQRASSQNRPYYAVGGGMRGR